jgi:hypothetical protein
VFPYLDLVTVYIWLEEGLVHPVFQNITYLQIYQHEHYFVHGKARRDRTLLSGRFGAKAKACVYWDSFFNLLLGMPCMNRFGKKRWCTWFLSFNGSMSPVSGTRALMVCEF